MNRDLTDRTPGEGLWLYRRACSLRQSEAAKLIGVGRTALSAAENDHGLPLKPPPGPRSAIRLEDLLRLARRRYGRGLRSTARSVGVSHRTLLAWERAGDDRLAAFWFGRGFRFGALYRG